ncbi:MAG: putative transposase [Acidimicrobiales bacterium]
MEVAAALEVSPATISRLLSKRKAPAPAGLFLSDTGPTDTGPTDTIDPHQPAEPTAPSTTCPTSQDDPELAGPELSVSPGAGAGRLVDAQLSSRYAGAMLLHPFLDRLGTTQLLGTLASQRGATYDTTALVLGASFGIALGASSMEGTKHLLSPDAGALIGLASFPELRTLRPRLGDIANSTDPVALQRDFAKAMLAADECPPRLYFCDDHFVAYTGGAPVAKGYNIRRHRAEPGRDDTVITDVGGRAICFASGEPKGLSVSLPDILAQLVEVCDGARVMVGFDRGGAYPAVFASIRDAGMDWVTYRRAPLVTPSVTPRRSWTLVDGHRVTMMVADEMVGLKDYGRARQLSVYEGAKMVFQVLTSYAGATPAALVRALRDRWCIESVPRGHARSDRRRCSR